MVVCGNLNCCQVEKDAFKSTHRKTGTLHALVATGLTLLPKIKRKDTAAQGN